MIRRLEVTIGSLLDALRCLLRVPSAFTGTSILCELVSQV